MLNAKSVAVGVVGAIAIVSLFLVYVGKASFDEVGVVVIPIVTGIFGLITDADSVVSKLKASIKKGGTDVQKPS